MTIALKYWGLMLARFHQRNEGRRALPLYNSESDRWGCRAKRLSPNQTIDYSRITPEKGQESNLDLPPGDGSISIPQIEEAIELDGLAQHFRYHR